ncbi:hypothetical protein [Bacillus salacetis]|nr:hypothetical protein [Bacillus salacetis]
MSRALVFLFFVVICLTVFIFSNMKDGSYTSLGSAVFNVEEISLSGTLEK